MTNLEKKIKWLEHARDVATYHVQVLHYAHSLPDDGEVSTQDEGTSGDVSGENPTPPLPPLPPK
jgi:hypothetical protein